MMGYRCLGLLVSLVVLGACSPEEESTYQKYRQTAEPECGNGRVEVGEICDGDDTHGVSCNGLGLGDGELGCKGNCLEFDKGDCGAPDSCGNDEVDDAAEVCDGDDLDGESCTSLGFDRGTLDCAANCADFDTSDCEDDCQPACGGKECGNDGCGGSCGECDEGQVCEAGSCEAGDTGCEPTQCGGECGDCPEGEVCDQGLCRPEDELECVAPGDCEDGLYCHLPTHSCVDCLNEEQCAEGQDCQDNVCVDVACVPVCGQRECGLDPACGESCGSCDAGVCNVETGMCRVVGADGLVVELTWSNSGRHPDLYLVKDTTDFCVAGRCYWENCRQSPYPDWDGTSATAADPMLSGYSADGYSASPVLGTMDAPVSGSYTIGVHYWDQDPATAPDLGVTVKVAVEGIPRATYTKTLDADALWSVARVHFSGGTGLVEPTDQLQLAWDEACEVAGDGCDQDTDCSATEYCAVDGGAASGTCAYGCRNDASCPEAASCNSSHQCVTSPVAGWRDPCGAGVECGAGLYCGILSGECEEYCYTDDGVCDGSTIEEGLFCCNDTGAPYCVMQLGFPMGYCSNSPEGH